MELVEGQSLETILSRGSIPFPTSSLPLCKWMSSVSTSLVEEQGYQQGRGEAQAPGLV